ncbi:MAG: hypothetical protein C4320_04245, partial [Armatimonadota bacterium]
MCVNPQGCDSDKMLRFLKSEAAIGLSYAMIASVAILAALPLVSASVPNGGVPAALLAKMGTGANITRWFCYQGNYNDVKHLTSYLGEADAAAFRRMKITWVRLCIAPEAAYTSVPDRNGTPNAKVMPYVDRAIQWFNRRGMAVLLDLHDNGQLKLDEAGRDPKEFLLFWRETARRYQGKGYDNLAFELVNEPIFEKNPKDWDLMQRKALAAIRLVDPKRTVMVSGTGYSSRDSLLKMGPLPQKNLLYT